MMGLENVLSVTLAFLIVTISPGPANLAVATVSMRSGRQTGLRFAAGLSLGLALWGVVAATGLGAALQTSASLLTTMKLMGAAYLVWLACQSARSAIAPEPHPQEQLATGERWFVRGLILNLSNPKAVVAWMAALSMGLGAGDNSNSLIAATMVCMALGFLNYAVHAMLFSMTGIMTEYRRLRRWIDGAAALLFTAAGFGLLRSAFSR